MGHIFLSYSRRDTKIMEAIKSRLKIEDFTVWTDELIDPGTPSWYASIETAIEASDHFILILSPESKGSKWVRHEIAYAQDHDVSIIPLLATGDVKQSVPLPVSNSQFIDIRQSHFEAGLDDLIATLQAGHSSSGHPAYENTLSKRTVLFINLAVLAGIALLAFIFLSLSAGSKPQNGKPSLTPVMQARLPTSGAVEAATATVSSVMSTLAETLALPISGAVDTVAETENPEISATAEIREITVTVPSEEGITLVPEFRVTHSQPNPTARPTDLPSSGGALPIVIPQPTTVPQATAVPPAATAVPSTNTPKPPPTVAPAPTLAPTKIPTVATVEPGQLQVLSSFDAPGQWPNGITWDGDRLWISENSSVIFKVTTAGDMEWVYQSPEATPLGLVWTGDRFWISTTSRARIYSFQIQGFNLVTGDFFETPSQTVGGNEDMAWDGANLWVSHEFNIYKLDSAGTVIGGFVVGWDTQGLAWDGSNFWVARNAFRSQLIKISPAGKILATYDTPVNQINGLEWSAGGFWVIANDPQSGDTKIFRLSLP